MNTSLRLALFCAVISLSSACPVVGPNEDGGAGGGTGTGGGEAVGGGSGGGVVGGGAGGGDDSGVGGGTGGGSVTGGGTGGGSVTGGGGGGSFDAGSSIDLNQFCDSWAGAYCNRESACLFLDSAQGMTCLARVKEACSAWQRLVGAGVYRYDAAQGAACVTATGNYSCVVGRGFTGGALNFDLGNGPVACDPLLVGVGVAGTPCTATADCSAGFTCTGTGTSCRTCTALPTVGQVCNPIAGNCFNSACRAAGDGGNECVAFAMPGQQCTGGASCDPLTTRGCSPAPNDGGIRVCQAKDVDGMPCQQSQTCASNYCNNGNRTDAGVRTCGPIALGRPCAATGDCEATAFCSGLTPNGLGVCSARSSLGSSCTIQRFADPNDGCASGGACFDGVCKPRHNQQQAGQSCKASATDCAPGTWCPPLPNDAGYPFCLAQGGAASPCTNTAECLMGLRCTNNVCVPLAGAGLPCFAQQQCKDTLTCPLVDAGMGFFACTPLVSAGGDCSVSGTSCASGVDNGQGGFCGRDGGSGTCFAPLSVGADCGGNAQCASGRCLTADAGVVATPNRGTCQAPCVP